jgi:uncharacterized protein YcbK (DUF882 family)
MSSINRRAFLRASSAVIASVASSFAVPALAKVAAPAVVGLKSTNCRTVAFACLYSGERLKADYWVDGYYVPEELARIDKALRDFRDGTIRPIEPKLLDFIHRLGQEVDAPSAFEVICGYRSPETNEWLRRRSTGVAEHSLHMKGLAIDLCVPGRALDKVHQAALHLRLGGVGYYPDSDFVHLDSGRVRRWTG